MKNDISIDLLLQKFSHILAKKAEECQLFVMVTLARLVRLTLAELARSADQSQL
ncbi:1103_t:CDS:1, partial [Funneliformis caledonium]